MEYHDYDKTLFIFCSLVSFCASIGMISAVLMTKSTVVGFISGVCSGILLSVPAEMICRSADRKTENM